MVAQVDSGTDSRSGRRPSYSIPALARGMKILEYLASTGEPAGVSDIARAVSVPKSSCFNILSTLEAAGYLQHAEDQRWSLTIKLGLTGMQSARNVNVLAVDRPILEALAHETEMTAHLAMLAGGGVVYADKVEPPGFVRFSTYPGKAASLHLTALARAIASGLTPDELDRMLKGYRFEGGTERAVRSRAQFEKLLDVTRRQGYAFELEEETEGVCCLAAPVFDAQDRVVAAVGVTGLTQGVLDPVSKLGERVRQAAAELTGRAR
jgi:DNA-binding IclR family transcriptional regulator